MDIPPRLFYESKSIRDKIATDPFFAEVWAEAKDFMAKMAAARKMSAKKEKKEGKTRKKHQALERSKQVFIKKWFR